MQTFLAEVAKKILEHKPYPLNEICLVFPNQRAALYFRKHLSELVDQPVWSPAIFTINDLMARLSGLQPAGSLDLLFELYEAYKNLNKQAEPFDDFYFWGELLLNDFDDVDKYRVNASDLFRNIKSIRDLEEQFTHLSPEQIEAIRRFWSTFSETKRSKEQEEFVHIWKILGDLYKKFKTALQEKDLAYEGMIYRMVADKIKAKDELAWESSYYYFVGFNALNSCEEILFDHLQTIKKAAFFWDYDNYYIRNNFHEAGLFLRNNIQKYPGIDTGSKDLLEKSKKDIATVAVPSHTGQAKILSNILGKLDNLNDSSPNNRAIVLADESLISSVIYTFPEEISEVNITMGIPILQTPVSSLIECLTNLQKQMVTIKGQPHFTSSSVIALLSHPYISRFEDIRAVQLKKEINENNLQYLAVNRFIEKTAEGKLFRTLAKDESIMHYLREVAKLLFASFSSEEASNTLDQEFLYQLFISINRLEEILSDYKEQLKMDTQIRLLKKALNSVTVPFTGEPLRGLQLMGILETRVLDFDHVIIVSMNEGIFPDVKAPHSFIPYTLRKGFKLPTIEHQDAIYAYYFYRLIQRAKKATLIYNNQNDSTSGGEASRYIHQLRYELPYEIKEYQTGFKINLNHPRPISIPKTPNVLKLLGKFTNPQDENYRPLSPTGLNTWLDCSLKFYFRYLIGIKPRDELLEGIDARIFGSILHKAIEILYDDFTGKKLETADIRKIKNKANIDAAIRQAFHDEYSKEKKIIDEILKKGQPGIIREVIYKYIREILKQDEKVAPLEILGLEKEWTIEFPVKSGGREMQFSIRGAIDRLDKTSEGVRVIDYKTGSDETSASSIKELFERDKHDRRKAVFQTLVYAETYKQNASEEGPLIPGVYKTRDVHDADFDSHLKISKQILRNYDAVRSEFLEYLKEMLAEMADEELPFEQTSNEKICAYCDFKNICHRKEA